MMARNSGTNVANGILSAIVLGSGIAFSVLVALLFRRVAEYYVGSSGLGTYTAYASAPLWSIGFGYMIPGLIGVIASLARQKGGYIAEMVFYILALIVMGVFFAIAFIALTALSMFNYSGCYSVGSSCTCLNGLTTSSLNIGYSCEDINALSSMSIGICAMLVIGWIFALIACITGGILACQQETQPGVVMQPGHHQPTVTVMQMGPMGQPQHSYVAQPGYGMQPGYGAHGYGAHGYGAHGYGAQQGYSYDYPSQPYTNPAYSTDYRKGHI